MIRFIQIFRLMQINYALMRYTMNRSVLEGRPGWLRRLSYLNPLSFLKQKTSRGESIRLALESLGPIFVKFGQILSTRHDLLPEDIVNELAKLQDQVPPFSNQKAITIIEKALGAPIQKLFIEFDEKPLASASIAQVYAAQLQDHSKVIVKVLRPNIKKMIRHDIALLYLVAKLTQRLWSRARRLRPIELVTEFKQVLSDELDLMREAANASQLRHNFNDSKIMYVPKVHWTYTRHNVLVIERIHGIPIANIKELQAQHTNMKKLAEHGVTIFFTQVFRDRFFHADMHPGNLFVDASDPENPRYLGVDFGIMGTLSSEDQYYLAENMLAFFHRDYRRIATLHIESAWVPPDTRISDFESAIRTVSEPIFEKPLSDISFGQLLLKLFQTAERYNMVIQPQLLLLQKTLFNIEGLGRQLYPHLDLWQTAKPLMEQWAAQQKSIKKMIHKMAPQWRTSIESIVKTPKLLYEVLHYIQCQQRQDTYQKLIPSSSKNTHYLSLGAGFALLAVGSFNLITQPTTYSTMISHHEPWIITTLLGGLLLLLGSIFRR